MIDSLFRRSARVSRVHYDIDRIAALHGLLVVDAATLAVGRAVHDHRRATGGRQSIVGGSDHCCRRHGDRADSRSDSQAAVAVAAATVVAVSYTHLRAHETP